MVVEGEEGILPRRQYIDRGRRGKWGERGKERQRKEGMERERDGIQKEIETKGNTER